MPFKNNCKEFLSDLYEFLHGKKLYEETGSAIDEENDIIESECKNEEKELSQFPFERLKKSLSSGNKKEKSLRTDENLTESSKRRCRVFRGTCIPTKLEIKLSERSEQKLFELGCYLTDAHQVKKEQQTEHLEEKKVDKSCEIGNDQNNSLFRTLKSDQHLLSENKNLMHQQENTPEAIEKNTFCGKFDKLLLKPQYCKYKKRFITMRFGKREIKHAFYQEEKLKRKKENREDMEENYSKQSGNESVPKSFGKKSKRFALATVFKKKKLKHRIKNKNNIADPSHSVKKQANLRLLPETKKLNDSIFHKEVRARRKGKSKRVQTDQKDMMYRLTQLLKKHKHLQEKNKSLSESLSCLLVNFDTTPSLQVIENNSPSKPIQSSSTRIKNLHKIFEKEEYKFRRNDTAE